MKALAVGTALAFATLVAPAIGQTDAQKYQPSQQYDPGASGKSKPDMKGLPPADDPSGESGAAMGEEGAASPDAGAPSSDESKMPELPTNKPAPAPSK